MLIHLDIRNVVLIDHVAHDMPRGLIVMTGETGAGKSIVLDALGLIRGDRADITLIRSGTDQASVTATFDLSANHPARHLMADQGLSNDGDIIIRRVLTRDGKSRAFINDQNVSAQFLKIISATLFDIVGQFDTGSLMDPSAHRDMLDAYGELRNMRDHVAWAYADMNAARAAYQTHVDQTARARADADYITESIKELDTLSVETGEEEKILSAKKYLNDQAQIIESLSNAVDKMTGRDGADGKLVQALRATERLRGKIPDDIIETWCASIDTALSILRDVSGAMEGSGTRGHDDDGYQSMEQVEDRLYALRAAARKFGCTVDALPDRLNAFEKQLAQITTDTDRVQELAAVVQRTEQEYAKQAGALSEQRRIVAKKLDQAIIGELPPLKLDKARFITDVSTDPSAASSTGHDQIRFCVAMNPGSDPAPLDRVASGGEMSRLMLALKVVLTSASNATMTLIFDEIDTGVGGAVADAMGDRLARLSRAGQVIVITHAPQVAVHADHHFVVAKKVTDNMTTTTITPLDDLNDRRETIARMLSGAKITDEARAAASKLLSKKVA